MPVEPSGSVALSRDDFSLFERHPIRAPWADSSNADQSRFKEIRQKLKFLSERAATSYRGSVRMRAFQSHPTPNGRNPLDLWGCIFPEGVGNKSFSLQYALIASSSGVEICFCLGSGQAQTASESLASLRVDFFRMKASLAGLDKSLIAETNTRLMNGGWRFRRSWRQPPNSSDFANLQDWIRFASSPQGNGASISRNLSIDDATTLGEKLDSYFIEQGLLFEPIFEATYPGASSAKSRVSLSVYETKIPDSTMRVEEPKQKKIWLISPGERARLWNQFITEKIIAIGWDYLGDLNEYQSKSAIAAKLREIEQRDTAPTNDAQACFDFSQLMNPGDLVFVKQGTRTIIGVGTITGQYEHRSEREEYKNVRTVDWTSVGQWQIPDDRRLVVKTLTDITPYSDYVNALRSLVAEEPAVENAPVKMAPLNYRMSDFLADTGISEATANLWLGRLRRKKQIIFQGPPGTGKTFISEKLAWVLASEGEGFVDILQLHPAYSYEDFVLGIRPRAIDGQLTFDYQRGRFLTFCEEAARLGADSPCVLVVDEINRANLPRVLGELLYLLEYRDRKIPLAGSAIEFSIPRNVHIIGTMNTADRSIALVDHALRRRFTFVTLTPDYDVLASFLERQGLAPAALVNILKKVNAAIEDVHHELGISFFMQDGAALPKVLEEIWKGEIEPYLEEYFYDDLSKVAPFRWNAVAPDMTSLARTE